MSKNSTKIGKTFMMHVKALIKWDANSLAFYTVFFSLKFIKFVKLQKNQIFILSRFLISIIILFFTVYTIRSRKFHLFSLKNFNLQTNLIFLILSLILSFIDILFYNSFIIFLIYIYIIFNLIYILKKH